jgi:hypothetical protein
MAQSLKNSRFARLRLVLLLGLLVIVGLYAWRKLPRSVPGIAFRGGQSQNLKLDKIPFYQQTDGRWGKEKLAKTTDSLASVGCTITSVSMGLARFGIDLTPDRLNQALNQKQGYTSQGWLIWHKIGEIAPVAIEVPAKPSHEVIDKALQKGWPVVANVLIEENVQHWILITGKQGQDYLINDPLGPKPGELLGKFKSQIYAIRILKHMKPATPS